MPLPHALALAGPDGSLTAPGQYPPGIREREPAMAEMRNVPEMTMGVVGASRDCFPVELARARLGRVVEECSRAGLEVVRCETIIENETDAVKAVAEMTARGADAVAVYLGNFGPEGPIAVFAREMDAPFMLCAAAEESKDTLMEGRGDAFCGMLNASYNCGLRGLRPHIPEAPVGGPADVAKMIAHFHDVARVLLGLRALKVFAFGPRPQDFFACNAPIKPLYDLGIEVMENSELDLLVQFRAAAGRTREIEAIAADMARELGEGNTHPEKLEPLARFEVALTTFMEENLGSREYGVFANKCWPAFEAEFGFVPCFVNSRLAARGIPVACEVDIYGAVSEYLGTLATLGPVTLLDINNTVPDDVEIADLRGAAREDLFMGFHCGNSPSSCLTEGACMKYQLIMHRLMEPGAEPNITVGTLEGRLAPSPVTMVRLQGTADCRLSSYLAEGHILDADTHTFGGTGIFGVPGFARFYRHVLVGKRFPHHAAVAFGHAGKALWDALAVLGVEDRNVPLPAGTLYPSENPFV
jgi:L-fucose isomerase-like protein